MTPILPRRTAVLTLLAASLPLLTPSTTHAAQVGLFQVSRSANFTQTSTAVPTVADTYEWSVDVDAPTAAFDSASIAYPPANTFPLNNDSFGFNGVAFEFSQSDLNTNFPTGTYTLTAHDSTNTNPDETPSINYFIDAYANTPALTAATFSALAAGIDPSQPFTLNFSPFVLNPNADSNSGGIFIGIFDSTNAEVLGNFFPSSQTSLVLSPNTLQPNTTYSVFFNFSDGINGSSNGTRTIQDFESTTTANFTTAGTPTPEPATLSLLALTTLPLLLRRRK